MIQFNNVTFSYSASDKNALEDFNLTIRPGEVICLTGLSGCGKSTVLRLINGLIPQFFSGEITGDIVIAGQNMKDYAFKDLSRQIGSIFQNPRSQFFCTHVLNELAFELENYYTDPEEIQSRIIRAVDQYQINDLLESKVFELSGGQQQMIACISIEIAGQALIVMDEPSSNLDFKAVRKLARMIQSWKQQGKTIVIAEHRLHYLLDLADRFILIESGQITKAWNQDDFRQLELKQLKAHGLRATDLTRLRPKRSEPSSHDVIPIQNWQYRYQKKETLDLNIERFDLHKGAITAIVGHNGAGKSTFAKALMGAVKLNKDAVIMNDTHKIRQKQWKHDVYQVFQNVEYQLFGETVEEEIRFSHRNMPDADLVHALDIIDLKQHRDKHPLSLSNGEMQRLAIASAKESGRPILVFDEPTSGLDGKRMSEFATELRQLKGQGYTILVITHDYELIINSTDYVAEFHEGEVKHHYPLDMRNVKALQNFFEL
ncbi:ABC transporter ATP-binding protein [Staphylococcus simulans]|uniref:ABC transporter ATP-binding protein n=1 Tax=Staphylococcus simulans TaxID=1286 RepID=UPI000BBD3D83|nr:ABC transporter ATP-binding protein [Staphylococcus simulans]ATF31249.1 ABC transporter [Staphylococcus simulans]